MLKWFSFIGLLLLYLYILSVLRRAKTNAWRFMVKGVGFFLLSACYFRQTLQIATNYMITAITGIFADILKLLFHEQWVFINLKHSALFVSNAMDSILLQINTECSGIIEILVFLSLIISFDIYNFREKIIHSCLGVIYLLTMNALRIMIIACGIHTFGYTYYNLFHSYIGRIFFWTASMLMYFYIFTRPQIRAMKVGDFKYR